ncbi:MAG: FecR domain-containing protein [Spirochaetota bacterium]|nr:FecR domain-containing protein [Spirochaetota bacterium]
MKKHPKKTDIISAALLKTSVKSKREKYVLSHIRECRQCSKIYESVELLLQPSDNTKINPSSQLETKIKRSYNKIEHGYKPHHSLLPFPINRYKRSFAYATALIILVISAFFYSTNRLDNNYKPISLSFNNINGNTKINNSYKIINSVNQDSIIKVDNNSSSEIFYKDILRIKLYDKTSIKVKQALFDKNLKRYKLTFDLEHGSINARFKHDIGLEYTFITSHAVINSIGTEFILKIHEKGTQLVLREGKLKVKSRSSNYEITASEGKEYFIDSKIRTRSTINNQNRKIEQGEDKKNKVKKLKNEPKKVEQKPSPSNNSSNKKNNKINKKERKETQKEMLKYRKSLRKELKGDRKEIKKIRKSKKNY